MITISDDTIFNNFNNFISSSGYICVEYNFTDNVVSATSGSSPVTSSFSYPYTIDAIYASTSSLGVDDNILSQSLDLVEVSNEFSASPYFGA